MTRRGARSASDASRRFAGALDWLYGFADAERGIGWNPRSSPSLGWNLRRTRILLDLAGGPDRRMAIVLVAGTKGKGSTAALLASILSASGARTGLYTKPHLQSYRERIRVDGEAIGEAAFADAVESFKPRVEALRSLVPAAGQPTTFELTTAMAFLHFSALGCTAAVVEVGLGGRLDATNATDPHVSVIAPISHDHMRELGTRLDQIAREKAGVIRPGRVVVVAAQRPTVAATIRAESLRVGSELRVARALSPAEGKRLGLMLRGPHQLQNAALAISAARALSEHGVVTVDDAHLVRGMSRVRWPGRFEVLPGPPPIVLDGAHNDGSAQALAVALRQEFRGRPIRLIVGMLRGKDAGAFARATAPLTRHVYVTAAQATRALPAEVLARSYRRARVFSALADALASARAEAGARDVIC
ncbi:MAG TPA: Mur ligase family protein, partial [Candidatus Limnocylindria bacterium]|nr:Mur ligase family protein [Candidatus Limnocylindria bacterium]